MKILRVIKSMDPKNGGPCQGIRNSIPELRKRGIDNEVLCFDSNDANYLGNDDFIIHTLSPSKGKYAYSSQLKHWLEDNMYQFDIIIIHGLWLYHSYGTYRSWLNYKRKYNKAPRLFVMPHGMLDPYFQKSKNRKFKAIRNWLFWKLIENKVVNGADGILFTCEEELLLAKKTFRPYHPKNELNIGYGILPPPEHNEDINISFSSKCNDWDGRPFFLFLSRIHEKKGIDLLIKAYIRINKERKNIPQLIIAGPGLDTIYGRKIKELARDNKNILFTGMLSGNAKWGAFYNCEIFILPSHQENFGISIVEAMACGKPLLITNKVNIWREIENSNAGFVVQDQEDKIYEMMYKWLSLTGKEDIGKQSRETYLQIFSVEKVVDKMIKQLDL